VGVRTAGRERAGHDLHSRLRLPAQRSGGDRKAARGPCGVARALGLGAGRAAVAGRRLAVQRRARREPAIPLRAGADRHRGVVARARLPGRGAPAMRRRSRPLARGLVIVLLALGPAVAPPHPAAAAARDGCPVGGVEVDLAGSADTAVVSGHAAAACQAAGWRPAGGGGPRTYWTYEIACSPDRVRASEGLCSRTPCPNGRFFAFRTLHRADGGTEPAGYSCVSLERARVGPTLTAADVFAAIRRVRLPTGAIRIAPSGRGLANLPSRLCLVGDGVPGRPLRGPGRGPRVDSPDRLSGRRAAHGIERLSVVVWPPSGATPARTAPIPCRLSRGAARTAGWPRPRERRSPRRRARSCPARRRSSRRRAAPPRRRGRRRRPATRPRWPVRWSGTARRRARPSPARTSPRR